jgi:MOSC domain-containing protein YiiM
MRVLSVNVGLPREVTWRGKPVRTGIYKEPVRGRVAVSTLNLAGDVQADLRVHGGPDKAVCAYPSEYYELWSRERPELEFLELGLYGFYLAVTREGHVEAGDPIVVLTSDAHRFGVTEVARLYARDRKDVESVRRAAELDALPESWRDFFRKRVSSLAARPSASVPKPGDRACRTTGIAKR